MGAGILRLPFSLIKLDVSGTTLSAKSVEYISSLNRLQRLILRDTQLSDTAPQKLALLKNLEFLGVTGNSLTDEMILVLREELPKCDIRPWDR